MVNVAQSWMKSHESLKIGTIVMDAIFDIMTRLNRELTEELDDAALRKRFEANVDLIRDLMFEITSRVKESLPDHPFVYHSV